MFLHIYLCFQCVFKTPFLHNWSLLRWGIKFQGVGLIWNHNSCSKSQVWWYNRVKKGCFFLCGVFVLDGSSGWRGGGDIVDIYRSGASSLVTRRLSPSLVTRKCGGNEEFIKGMLPRRKRAKFWGWKLKIFSLNFTRINITNNITASLVSVNIICFLVDPSHIFVKTPSLVFT